MRKTLLCMLCLLLSMAMLLPAVTAEESFPDDPFDHQDGGGVDALDGSRESIEIVINGTNTPLAFDGSTQFSSIMDGTVQASFYAYSNNSDYLYELYMIFPDTVQSGSVITPDYALQNHPDCSVVLILSNKDNEQYFYAGQVDGRVYPTDASYSMRFDTVTSTDSTRTYTGKLSAALAPMDPDSGDPIVSFKIENAPFSFTISLEQDTEDGNPFQEFPDDELPGPLDPGAFVQPTPTQKAYKV